MSPARGTRRTGGATGNLLLVAAFLFLAAALVAPKWRARTFELRVESVSAAVDGLRAAAQGVVDATGSWPSTSEGLAFLPAMATPDSTITLEWRRIASTVVPTPPSGAEAALPETDEDFGPQPAAPTPDYFERGAISVHSADDALLARMLERYPGSFVHDTVWTLLLPRVSARPE